jgi:hypothetical protein
VTYTALATCNSACVQTADCTLVSVSASGSMIFQDCDWEGSCSPNYMVGRIRTSGNQIIFDRSQWNTYYEVGRITLTGATASGSMIFQDCDWEGSCSPNYEIGRIRTSGSQIIFDRSQWNTYYEVGRITLAATTYACPLGASHSCSGTPPRCSAPQTCETITVCP